MVLFYAITGFLVVVNKILQILCIKMITWIGYDTHSNQITKITNGVFVAQLFNIGFVLLLVNANFAETFTGLQNLFQGPFSDYSPQWYA